MLGIRVGTTPLDVNARTTAADDCAEMPTGEQLVARFSVGVGTARTTVAVERKGLYQAVYSGTLIFIIV